LRLTKSVKPWVKAQCTPDSSKLVILPWYNAWFVRGHVHLDQSHEFDEIVAVIVVVGCCSDIFTTFASWNFSIWIRARSWLPIRDVWGYFLPHTLHPWKNHHIKKRLLAFFLNQKFYLRLCETSLSHHVKF
jgi:hypothetical protein